MIAESGRRSFLVILPGVISRQRQGERKENRSFDVERV